MPIRTADLCDQYADTEHLQVAEPMFRSFGANTQFSGRITTLKVFEDNVLIRKVLENKVSEGVLVIDGGGSHRCALLGGNIARMACDNGWEGIILYGCVRDAVELADLPIGIRALNTHPLRSHKRGVGDQNVSVTFAGVNFKADHYLYADEDGIVVSGKALV